MITELNNNLITYKQLSNGFFTSMNSDDMIVVKLDTEDPNRISFRVEVGPNIKIFKHCHNCEETVIVYKGELRDTTTGSIIKEKEMYVVPKGKTHELKSSNQKTIFYIEFTNPDV